MTVNPKKTWTCPRRSTRLIIQSMWLHYNRTRVSHRPRNLQIELQRVEVREQCSHGNTHPWICLQPCRAVSFSGSFRTFQALSSLTVSTSLFFVASRARSVSYSECNSGSPIDPLLVVSYIHSLFWRTSGMTSKNWNVFFRYQNKLAEAVDLQLCIRIPEQEVESPESMEVRDLCIPHTINPVVGWRSFASFKSSFGLSMLPNLNL